MVTKRASSDIWSYPNIHGDIVTTADATGARIGATMYYDPFGQALGTIPDNQEGTMDYAWLGKHQRPLEHQTGLATIEMGARQYVPSLGRFLEVDPIEGGSANDYDYAYGDPINGFDLDGQWPKFKCKWCRRAAKRVGRVLDNPWVQGVVTVAACSAMVGCGLAIAVVTAWNAGRRLRREGFGASFVRGTAIDVALAVVPFRALRGLARPSVSAYGRPLRYAQSHDDWARSTLRKRAVWNGVLGGTGIARGHTDW